MSIVTFGLEQLDELKAKALAAPLKRARINLHEHLTDRVQEMVIAEHRSTYVRPHRHPGRLESFHILNGACTVVIFNDAGAVTKVVRLSAGSLPVSGRHVICRQRESVWHTLLIESEFAVIHEVVEGPFPYETEWAPWSPGVDDVRVPLYLDELRRQVS